MPLTCGVTLNLNNLKGDLEARAQAILNIDLGTPDGLQEIANKIEGELSAIADRVAAVVVIPPINISLRDELAALAALPLASIAAAAKIISIAEEFADAIGLQGFVNLNLNDLSKSVFSLSTTFDPCNPTIPNILKGPDGTLQKLPSIQPILGSTEAALKVAVPNQTTIDNLALSLSDNVDVSSIDINSAVSTIQSNVTPVITGMGDMVRKLPTGEEVIETRDNFIDRIKQERLELLSEILTSSSSSSSSSGDTLGTSQSDLFRNI